MEVISFIAVCIVNQSDGTGTVLYSTLVSFSVKSRDEEGRGSSPNREKKRLTPLFLIRFLNNRPQKLPQNTWKYEFKLQVIFF